jgi:hypothetical protein
METSVSAYLDKFEFFCSPKDPLNDRHPPHPGYSLRR